MKLNTNSWHARYYKQWYQKELPISLCPYFWMLLLSLVSLPITWPSLITSHRKININAPGWGIGTVLWLISLCCGLGLLTVFHDKKWIIPPTYIIWLPFVGMMVVVVIGGISTGFLLLILLIKDKLENWRNERKYLKRNDCLEVEKKPNWLTEGVKAFFGKYCPKIEWLN